MHPDRLARTLLAATLLCLCMMPAAAWAWSTAVKGAGHQAAVPLAGGHRVGSRFLQARAGRTSFAVVDDTGELGGLRVGARFRTASVVKVMVLVAYLQMLSARHHSVSFADNSLLYPMIHISTTKPRRRSTRSSERVRWRAWHANRA